MNSCWNLKQKIIQSYIVIESSMSIKQEVKQLNLYKYHLIQKLQKQKLRIF